MATSMGRIVPLIRAQIPCHSPLYSRVLCSSWLPIESARGLMPIWRIQVVKYAKKAAKSAKSIEPRELMQVSTDPHYLVTHCSGSNYFKEGQDVKLGPDEDYPNWLWDLHTGPPPKLEELSPDTPQYWRRLRKMHMKRTNRLAKMKKF